MGFFDVDNTKNVHPFNVVSGMSSTTFTLWFVFHAHMTATSCDQWDLVRSGWCRLETGRGRKQLDYVSLKWLLFRPHSQQYTHILSSSWSTCTQVYCQELSECPYAAVTFTSETIKLRLKLGDVMCLGTSACINRVLPSTTMSPPPRGSTGRTVEGGHALVYSVIGILKAQGSMKYSLTSWKYTIHLQYYSNCIWYSNFVFSWLSNQYTQRSRLIEAQVLHTCTYMYFMDIHVHVHVAYHPLSISTHPQSLNAYTWLHVELAHRITTDRNEVWAQDLYHSTALVEGAKCSVPLIVKKHCKVLYQKPQLKCTRHMEKFMEHGYTLL